MKIFSKPSLSIVALAVSSILLTACGGSSSGGGTTPTNPGFSSKTVTGTAIDSYLSGSTIEFTDCDGVTVTTNAQGQFVFNTTENCQNSALTISGGIDTGTGLPFTGTLKLKKTDLQNMTSSSGLTVTPLTSLEAALIAANQQNLLATLLNNLGIDPTKDLSSYDYVQTGSSTIAARVFLLQQLITKIEDTLQASGVSGAAATDAAFSAVANVLATSTTPLFSGSTAISDALMGSMIQSAITEAQKTVPNLVISADIQNGIRANISSVSNAVNAAIALDPNKGIQAVMDENKAVIEANLKAADYGDLTLSGHTLTELKNSSVTSPILLPLLNIDNILNVGFKLNSVSASTVLKDSAQLAFELRGTQGTRTEDLNVIISHVDINFKSDGTIESVTIPANTAVDVVSTLNNVSTSLVLNANTNIVSNGTFSLRNILAANSTLEGYYNRYIGGLRVGDAITATAYVKTNAYVISPNLALEDKQVTIKNQTFLGKAQTAYFKLN